MSNSRCVERRTEAWWRTPAAPLMFKQHSEELRRNDLICCNLHFKSEATFTSKVPLCSGKDRKRVSHPPNLNLLFSPRKTSLCFLRLVLRPAVAMATKLATARARQLIPSTFIAHRLLWRSGCDSSISTTSSSMLHLQLFAVRPLQRSRFLWDVSGPPRRKSREVEAAPIRSVLLLDLSAFVCGFVVLSLIKIDMNLFLVVIEEWH